MTDAELERISWNDKAMDEVGLESRLTQEERVLLNRLYAILWCDAYYDPLTTELCEYAKKLVPLIEELNKTLHFKR